MARVPLQQTPTEQFDTGGDQFFTGGGNVTPVQDVVSDDLRRVSTSMRQVAQIATQLQDEYNDAEAKKLLNEYDAKVQEIETEYLNLEGFNAVATTKTGDGVETESTYDQYIKRINELLENGADQASNGQIRSMFETTASVTARSAKNRMTNHSIQQQRKYLENEQEASIQNLTTKSINNFESWANPEGNFQKFYTSGLIEIIKKNKLKGRITEGPNASEQYIQEVYKYNDKIAEGVINNLAKINKRKQEDEFLLYMKPFLEPTALQKLVNIKNTRHTNFATNLKVDAVMNDNTNQNSNNIVGKAHKLNVLYSNNNINNGLGGFVENGFNSNDALLDITGKPTTEQIDALEKLRNTSIFYDPEKTTKLIPQHEIIHLFAIQKIGVPKADSLYKKAEREYELPDFKNTFEDNKAGRRKYAVAKKKFEEEFLKNPDNEKIIKAAILDKYIDFIKEEITNKFNRFYGKTKTIFPNAPQREDFGKGADEAKKFREARKEFLNNPENQVQVNPGVATEDLEAMTGTKTKVGRDAAKRFKEEKLEKQNIYIDQIANDLNILKNDVNYDNEIINNTDFKTGLTPLSDKKKLIKATITNKEEQQAAIKKLEEKYNEYTVQKEKEYNTVFNIAKEISFARPSGWEDLAAAGIQIENFSESDQTLLKNGQPKESDANTVVEIINNPANVATNLEANSHKLSNGQYQKLKLYAASLNSDKAVVEAEGNITMLKATLDRYDMGELFRRNNDKNNRKYIAINDAWLKEINARQISNGNRKLTMGEKQEALNYVLLTDLVSVNRRFLGPRTDVIPSTVEFDNVQNVFVNVFYKGENVKVFTSKINKKVLKLIQDSIRGKNKYPTQSLVAEYWLKSNKAETEAEARKNLENYGLID